MLYFALRAFRCLITFSFNIKQQFQKIKINSFISIRHPFPSLLLPSPSLLQSYFEMVWLCSLSLLFWILLFFLLFLNLSLFPPATYVHPSSSSPVCSRSILPIHFLRSIPSVSSPLHFPSCLWIFFSHPPRFFPVSCSCFSYSPVEVPPRKSIRSSLFSFIVPSTPLLIVFISLLYIIFIFNHYEPPIWTFLSKHPSSSSFSCRFSSVPNFTLVSSSLFLFCFYPLTFPFVLFR
jgi:hypothetical protein